MGKPTHVNTCESATQIGKSMHVSTMYPAWTDRPPFIQLKDRNTTTHSRVGSLRNQPAACAVPREFSSLGVMVLRTN